MKKLIFGILLFVIFFAIGFLTGCSSSVKPGEPVYQGPHPLEQFKGPGDYLWEYIQGE